jgi:hypothetical protein
MRGSITASPNGESFPIKTTLTLQGNFTLANVPANPTAVALILTPPNAASRKYVAGFPIDGVGIVRTDVGVYGLTFTPAALACGSAHGRERAQSRRRPTSRSQSCRRRTSRDSVDPIETQV